MKKILDVVSLILRYHPQSEELANSRITKLVYLVDWRSCLQYGKQVTPIEWIYNDYGPFVWDVLRAVGAEPDYFSVKESATPYGTTKTVFESIAHYDGKSLSILEIHLVMHVIATTKDMGYNEFVRFVYSTYPVLASTKYEYLDLPKLAFAHKSEAGSGQA